VPVPAFDANAKCFGGGWFEAVRWHESRDCASGYFSMTCPWRISLRLDSRRPSKKKVESIRGGQNSQTFLLPLRRQPLAVTCQLTRLSPNIYVVGVTIRAVITRTHAILRRKSTERCSVSRGHSHAYKWFSRYTRAFAYKMLLRYFRRANTSALSPLCRN